MTFKDTIKRTPAPENKLNFFPLLLFCTDERVTRDRARRQPTDDDDLTPMTYKIRKKQQTRVFFFIFRRNFPLSFHCQSRVKICVCLPTATKFGCVADGVFGWFSLIYLFIYLFLFKVNVEVYNWIYELIMPKVNCQNGLWLTFWEKLRWDDNHWSPFSFSCEKEMKLGVFLQSDTTPCIQYLF